MWGGVWPSDTAGLVLSESRFNLHAYLARKDSPPVENRSESTDDSFVKMIYTPGFPPMTKKLRGVRGMIPNATKVDETLVRRLEAAAARELTSEELRAQRVSFVYGNMPQDSSLSRKEVVDALAKAEGIAV